MSKTAVIRARVEPELKEQAETIFERLGVSTTQAIGMFYKQVILRRGLPFDVAIPNATTRRTFEAADAGRDVVLCRDADDLFKKLGRSRRNDSRGLEEHPSQGTRTPRKAPRHEEGLKCEG